MRSRLVSVAVAAGLFVGMVGSARAQDTAQPLDTVFLSNGGRLRGTVMEQDPKLGVSIRLLDGTVRKLPSSQVQRVEYEETAKSAPVAAPAPPPPPAAPAPVVAPLYVAPAAPLVPRMHRRSKGLFVTGLILMPLGGVGVGVGAGLVGVGGAQHGDGNDGDTLVAAGGAALAIGGTLLVTGLVFTIVGGAKVEDQAAPQAPSVLDWVEPVVGLGTMGAKIHF